MPNNWKQAATLILNEIEDHLGDWFGYGTWEDYFDNDNLCGIATGALRRLQTERMWDRERFLEMFTNKHRDYGTQNILKFGREGIRVRLWDKIARLENLARTGVKPRNERVVDTLEDMIGYSILAEMLKRDWFELPVTDESMPSPAAANIYVGSPDPFYAHPDFDCT